MGSMDELRSPSLPTSPAAPIIVFPSPSMLPVLQLLGTIRCPEKPRAAQARIASPESALECAVQHGRAHVQEGLHARPVPAHLLRLVHALGHDLIDRALHERGRERLTTPTPSSVMHQRCLVALEIAQQLADVSLEAANAGHLAYGRALRPAA